MRPNLSKKSYLTRAKIWIRELRAPFFTCTLVPVFLGAAVAWNKYGFFNPLDFALTLIATLSLHAGANMVDDYFDYKIGADRHKIYKDLESPFFGGSRVLNENLLRPESVYVASVLSFSIGCVVGTAVALRTTPLIFLLGGVGLFFGYFHVTLFSKLGLGEFSLFLNFGPLITAGSFLAQAEKLEFSPFVASMPVGILMGALLLVNGIPDLEADRDARKKTVPVRIGKRKSVFTFGILLALTYFFVILAVSFETMPKLALISLATFPLGARSFRFALKNYRDPQKFSRVNKWVYILHFSTGALLIVGYILDSIVR